MKNIIALVFVFLLSACSNWANYIDPNDTSEALKQLDELVQTTLRNKKLDINDKAWKLLGLGAWELADSMIQAYPDQAKNTNMAKARLAYLNNNFIQTETLVEKQLETDATNVYARELWLDLLIQKWSLHEAEQRCKAWQTSGKSEMLAIKLGKIFLLSKKYKQALEQAKYLQKHYSKSGSGYLLEADVHFWNQHPQLSEQPLRKSLEIDPFNADARFSYGYAIWRRVDATQLDAMVAQWEVALKINPKHYITHWHWGNGHTNLTYEDYAMPQDDTVRSLLHHGDSLIADGQLDSAISFTHELQINFPRSVLPAMMRGSVFYMEGEGGNLAMLDSAEAVFMDILSTKKHYGPAHNGLAAVIKSKRFPYLTAYDTLEQALEAVQIMDMEEFVDVFPDITYYPGDRIARMVYGELHASRAYIPMLSKLERTFALPPLHRDLTDAMKSPYFRGGTTFDNRQWMDIRGVGSGATGIEYVERGAHLERNVTLHEYTHLYHGLLFSDHEKRRVRELYYHAKKNDLTLDYYSANNESEYLAQTYTAYFAPVKVHPLNHKSMNTHNELEAKDPQLFAFLDSLVSRHEAYLDGDSSALSENWAETYLQLAQRKIEEKEYRMAGSYIDSAFRWNSRYVPVFIAKAKNEAYEGRYNTVDGWLKVANNLKPRYAPLIAVSGEIAGIKFKNGDLGYQEATKQKIKALKEALSIENDLTMQVSYSRKLWSTYLENAQVPEAVNTAQQYIESASTLSTYLIDRKEEAILFRDWLMSSQGYNDGLEEMSSLAEANPQNYRYLKLFAESLVFAGKYNEAIDKLMAAQNILYASGNPRQDFELMLAENHLMLYDTVESMIFLEKALNYGRHPDKMMAARILAEVNRYDEAEKILRDILIPDDPWALSDYYYTKATLATEQNSKTEYLEKAISINPYHGFARSGLITLLKRQNNMERVASLIEEAKSQALPPGKALLSRWADDK